MQDDAITDVVLPDTTVTDALGRAVTFSYPPPRVLSLAPNLTEVVFAVGAGDRLAGASPADTYPPAAAALPRFSTFPIDHERLVALEPDLLLATDQINATADVSPFKSLGIPAYFFSFERVADVPAALRQAGALLGGDGEGPARRFEARVDSVRRAVEGRPRPRTLLLVSDDVLYAFGRSSYASEAIELAGGESVTDEFYGPSATLSDEWVLEQAPEVVVVLAEPYDPSSLLAYHPTWQNMPAVREGRG